MQVGVGMELVELMQCLRKNVGADYPGGGNVKDARGCLADAFQNFLASA